MSIQFYTAPGSNSAERVEWCLNYKAIPFERIDVDEGNTEFKKLSKNTFGYVPVLSVDGVVIIESMAIIEYLEEQFSQKPLIGNSSIERAQVRMICELVNSTIHSPQNRNVLGFYRPEITEEDKSRVRREWIVNGLDKLKSTVRMNSKFAVGTHFTIADIFIASIYKKAIAHGAVEIEFYEDHLDYLRSIEAIRLSEPKADS